MIRSPSAPSASMKGTWRAESVPSTAWSIARTPDAAHSCAGVLSASSASRTTAAGANAGPR